MSDRDFGALIRRRRQRLDLTQTRVAELIGRAPGTIRAWEAGRSTPADPEVVSTLAVVLGIGETDLLEAAGIDQPARRQLTPSLLSQLRSIAPPPQIFDRSGPEAPATANRDPAVPVLDLPPEPETPEPETPEPETPEPERLEPETLEPEDVASDLGVREEGVREEGVREEGVWEEARAGSEPQVPETEMPLPDVQPLTPLVPAAASDMESNVISWEKSISPTQTSAVALSPEPPTRRLHDDRRHAGERADQRKVRAKVAATARPVALIPVRPAVPSYMEDPTERFAYRLRSLYTAVGIAVLLVALVWTAGQFVDALSSSWNDLFSKL